MEKCTRNGMSKGVDRLDQAIDWLTTDRLVCRD